MVKASTFDHTSCGHGHIFYMSTHSDRNIVCDSGFNNEELYKLCSLDLVGLCTMSGLPSVMHNVSPSHLSFHQSHILKNLA